MYMLTSGSQPGIGTQLIQRGLAGCGDSCKCGGKCQGLGLFDSGLDLSGWDWPEMAIAGLGLYMLLATISTTRRGYQSVRSGARKRRSGRKRKADLEWRKRKLDRELSEL